MAQPLQPLRLQHCLRHPSHSQPSPPFLSQGPEFLETATETFPHQARAWQGSNATKPCRNNHSCSSCRRSFKNSSSNRASKKFRLTSADRHSPDPADCPVAIVRCPEFSLSTLTRSRTEVMVTAATTAVAPSWCQSIKRFFCDPRRGQIS